MPSFSRVNQDTTGCVWSGEFDLNTVRVDKKIFESGKTKISGYVWTGTKIQGFSRRVQHLCFTEL